MTENELRAKVVAQAQSWVGCKESDGSHRKIIDLYNSHKPLARGYSVKYTDAWCSTFASACAIATGMTDIIPTECGCEKHIQLFKKIGSWEENDAYVPKPADYVFYDWQDGANYATTDNTGAADHIGIVEKVTNGTITVIEGNMSNAVGRRNLKVNGQYIRGFGIPNYAKKAGSTTPVETPILPSVSLTLSIGDVVDFKGNTHYSSANANTGIVAKPGPAKVTAISANSKHSYHVVHTDGTSNVYGWVNASDLSVKSVELKAGDKVRVADGATVYGKTSKFSAFVYRSILYVRQVDGDRVVISTLPTGAVTGAIDRKYLTKV